MPAMRPLSLKDRTPDFQSGNVAINSSTSGAVNTIYEATCQHRWFLLNGTTYTGSSTWTNLNANIYLFGSYTLAESSILSTTRTKGALYYCRIYENNVLVRDLVPVIRKSDNEPCMYDAINETFYVNTGTGTFLYG